jgi:hypothetical protein
MKNVFDGKMFSKHKQQKHFTLYIKRVYTPHWASFFSFFAVVITTPTPHFSHPRVVPKKLEGINGLANCFCPNSTVL